MTHPADTCYHVLKANDGINDIQEALDSIAGQPFGNQNTKDQTGAYIVIDCKSANPFSSYPELATFIILAPPSWITDVVGATPENSSYAEAKALVHTEGDPNTAWSAPVS